MYFDLRKVHDHLHRSLLEKDDIDIQAYLEAYNELYKWVWISRILTSHSLNVNDLYCNDSLFRFFQLMGSVFSFVSSDLKHKIDFLQSLINQDLQNYASIKKMIDFEKEKKRIKHDRTTGARTLLKLHRGLGTLYKQLYVSAESCACSSVYSNCLLTLQIL